MLLAPVYVSADLLIEVLFVRVNHKTPHCPTVTHDSQAQVGAAILYELHRDIQGSKPTLIGTQILPVSFYNVSIPLICT